MKHITLSRLAGISTVLAALFGMLMSAQPVLAATTASLTPVNIRVSQGQQFNVTVAVDPQGAKDYAEKIEVDYPAALVQETSFTFSGNWTPLEQPGYDSVDNAGGSLVKTAGYAGGLSSATVFGTISFVAEKSGTGQLSIGGASQAFELSGNSAVTGGGSSVTVTATAVRPAAVVAPSTPVPSAVQQSDAISTGSSTLDAAASASAPNSTSQVAAAAAATVPSGGGNLWIWIIGIVVVIAGGAYFLMKKRV